MGFCCVQGAARSWMRPTRPNRKVTAMATQKVRRKSKALTWTDERAAIVQRKAQARRRKARREKAQAEDEQD